MKNEEQNHKIQENKEKYNFINKEDNNQNFEKKDNDLIKREVIFKLMKETLLEKYKDNIKFIGNKRVKKYNEKEDKE